MEEEHTTRFDCLFNEDKSRLELIVTFLALLEILRLGLARAYQDGEFGTLWIMRQAENAATE